MSGKRFSQLSQLSHFSQNGNGSSVSSREEGIPLMPVVTVIENHGAAGVVKEKAKGRRRRSEPEEVPVDTEETDQNKMAGMRFSVTVLFIIGETAGGGLIALPKAMVSTGLFFGTIMTLVVAALCVFTGSLIAESLNILRKRWPVYQTDCREPFPAMAYRTHGKWARFLTIFILQGTTFSTAVVFVSLLSRNFQVIISLFTNVQFNQCYMIMFTGLVLLPAIQFGTPKDFWQAIVLAMITTTLAVIMLVIGSLMDFDACSPVATYPTVAALSVYRAWGTNIFAFGGHGAFPTIQNDMRQPERFGRAVQLAFIGIIMMYTPVTYLGYFVYADSITDSILPSIQKFHLQLSTFGSITTHVLSACLIVFNPLSQQVEAFFGIEQGVFTVERFMIRTTILFCVCLCAMMFPSFGILMDFVGGSLLTSIVLIMPCLFFMYLAAGDVKHGGRVAEEDEERLTIAEVVKYCPRAKFIGCIVTILIALWMGLGCTLAATDVMAHAEASEKPCFYDAIFGNGTAPDFFTHVETNDTYVACCGHFRNISVYSTNTCLSGASALSGH